MRPDFNKIQIKQTGQRQVDILKWEKENNISESWQTAEQIPVKPVYTQRDLEYMEHLDYAAGIPPYLRGPYSTMFVMRPWM